MEVLASLAAPRLRHLTIKINIEGNNRESPTDFCEEDIEWTTGFASQRTDFYSASKLNKLTLLYNLYAMKDWDLLVQAGRGSIWRTLKSLPKSMELSWIIEGLTGRRKSGPNGQKKRYEKDRRV